jgi:hypothetical protein
MSSNAHHTVSYKGNPRIVAISYEGWNEACYSGDCQSVGDCPKKSRSGGACRGLEALVEVWKRLLQSVDKKFSAPPLWEMEMEMEGT